MQEMQTPSGERLQEFFQGGKKLVDARMKQRRAELEHYGYKFVGTERIGRNAKCPCGSDKKFKKCCIAKVERVVGQNFVDMRA